MDEWVTTKQASEIKKVGLSAHRIAALANCGDIVADRTGKKKWLVKVTLNGGKWELVPTDKPKQKPANSTQPEQETARTPAYEELLAFLREWREQIQLLSLHQLLDACLFQKRHEDLERTAIESEEVKNLYLGATARHLEALRPLKTALPCEHTVLFKRFRDKYPDSGVWQAQESFDDVYGGYFEAFFSWLVRMDCTSKSPNSRLTEALTSDTDIEASSFWQAFNQELSKLNKVDKIDRDFWLWSRLFTLIGACHLLAIGIGEQAQQAFWIPELNGIRKLRNTVEITIGKELPRVAYQVQMISNGALLLAKHSKSYPEFKQKTEVLLEKRRSLETAKSDVLAQLGKLELTLSG